jgi:hypothetical protein
MASGLRRVSQVALVGGSLLLGPAALAQAQPPWVDPPTGLSAPAPQPGPAAFGGTENGAMQAGPESVRTDQDDPVATSSVGATRARPARAAGPAEEPLPAVPVTYRLTEREKAARDLAFDYLDHWSAPNRVSLASASSFYGPSLTFHGQRRSFDSVLAEKRRVAERWPERTYRYRRETTQVACDTGGPRCTVWSIFDFTAASRDNARRSAGIGDHELVVSFSGPRPVIVAENSRVLRRGAAPAR